MEGRGKEGGRGEVIGRERDREVGKRDVEREREGREGGRDEVIAFTCTPNDQLTLSLQFFKEFQVLALGLCCLLFAGLHTLVQLTAVRVGSTDEREERIGRRLRTAAPLQPVDHVLCAVTKRFIVMEIGGDSGGVLCAVRHHFSVLQSPQ